ncbi:hypothetical protein PRIC2_002243 [Phytophthora ramorum]
MSASGIPKEEAELIERFKAFVEQEARLQQAKFHAFSAERAQQVQAEFWAKMKAALCVNKFSENLEVLDYVAAAIINGSPDPEQAFCRPVMILPRPERQRFGVESTAAALTEQKSEAPPAKRNSPPSSHASEGEAVPSKKAKTVACTMNTLRSTEAKELPTAGGVSGRIGQTGGTVVNAAATPELKLSAKTPVQLEISSLSPESTPVGSTTVPAFDAKETKTVGWAAYKLVDGSPSALTPRVKVPLQKEGYFLNDGDEEEEKGK